MNSGSVYVRPNWIVLVRCFGWELQAALVADKVIQHFIGGKVTRMYALEGSDGFGRIGVAPDGCKSSIRRVKETGKGKKCSFEGTHSRCACSGGVSWLKHDRHSNN